MGIHMQRYMNHAALLLMLVFISACANRTQPMRVWNASVMAEHAQDGAAIELFDNSKPAKGKKKSKLVVATINADDVRNLIRIQQRVESAVGELHAELLLAEGNEPNGFSFSHGTLQFIAVNIGMLNLLSQDEDATAALLGHELAHLYLAHGKQRQDRENDRAITTTVIAFALGVVGIPFGAVDFATGTIAKSYTREEERDADRFGLTFMSQAGFDPRGAVRLYEKLEAVPGGSGISFLSTHPSTAERIENMKRLAQELH